MCPTQQLHLRAISWFNFDPGQGPLGVAQAMSAEFILSSLARSVHPHGADPKLAEVVQILFSGTAQSEQG